MKYTLQLSNKFHTANGTTTTVDADGFEVHGGGHNGIYVFKNKAKSSEDINEWIACYPVEDTIIIKIENIK